MEKKKRKEGRAVPNARWEVRVQTTAPSRNMVDTQGADFNPKRPSERKTTYIKVNDQDY